MRWPGRRWPLLGLIAIALLVHGCGSGGGPRSVLGNAINHIGEIRAGQLAVRFTLAPNTDPASNTVGVAIQGSFALDPHQRLPILHVSYTRIAGAQSKTVRLDSDGRSGTIRNGQLLAALDSQQQQVLAGTLQGPQGLGNLPLHIDRWVNHPRQGHGPKLTGQSTDKITGTVNLTSALSDLNQISSGQVTQATGVAPTNTALAKTLRASSFLAVIGHNDHLLRRLNLRIILVPSTTASGPATQGLTITLNVALTPQPLPH